jgi:hypothetical protein
VNSVINTFEKKGKEKEVGKRGRPLTASGQVAI